MGPFKATTSSIGNKQRLAGYYKKNKVVPLEDEEENE